MAKSKPFRDIDMQLVIGQVLRWGVIISMLVVVFGGVVYIYRHGHVHADYSLFKGVPDFISSPSGIIHNAFALRGRAIIQAGIILLVATPIVRVLFSAIGFVLEKDYLYVGITLVVLSIIAISMLGGHAG